MRALRPVRLERNERRENSLGVGLVGRRVRDRKGLGLTNTSHVRKSTQILQ